jgi:hypothetical protein
MESNTLGLVEGPFGALKTGKPFTAKNYQPEVQYYYARNKVWILRP